MSQGSVLHTFSITYQQQLGGCGELCPPDVPQGSGSLGGHIVIIRCPVGLCGVDEAGGSRGGLADDLQKTPEGTPLKTLWMTLQGTLHSSLHGTHWQPGGEDRCHPALLPLGILQEGCHHPREAAGPPSRLFSGHPPFPPQCLGAETPTRSGSCTETPHPLHGLSVLQHDK